ncbi:DivIVA domain-containing protein [Streptococcus entericus]|uniref:DivIVA domain-containing protein n=1 Tax=Streptococcus entericus TaxID=155680 RepID=UPI00036C4051|nr:DivIVA domain-containing protein [Streptococcus entericus]
MLTALDIKDKTFRNEFRGYHRDEVNEFLDIVIDDYETLVRLNREQEQRIRDLEEKLAYFGDMKESLTQSVILAQETSEKVKLSARTEADNILNKATHDAKQLIEEAKVKANQLLRDASDDAKRVAVETEDLKRQTRIFHQRLLATVEAQLGLVNAPEWQELLQPTAVYLQNSDAAFKEVVEKVLGEHVPEIDDTASIDATRQFSPEEMAELQRRIAEANAQLEQQGPVPDGTVSGDTQTFKLNI